MKSLTTSTQNQAGAPKSRLLTCMVATTLLLALAIPALVVAQNLALNYTILYAFTGADGTFPVAPVVQDSQGNLYGTTVAGGNLGSCSGLYGAGCGVVFKLSPSGAQTVLHAFTGGTDGAEPMGTLLLGPGGNLYGTAYSGGDVHCVGGGSGGCGVLFKIDSHGNYSVLHTFESGAADGNGPRTLVEDSAGNLYGNTDFGGGACPSDPQVGCGVVFKLDTNNQLTVLHSFTGQADGRDPIGHPTLGRDGNIYGTTYQGGTLGQGIVFKLSPNPDGTWTESWTYNFTAGGDGKWPVSAVIRDDGGNLYGAASSGGIGGNGTVFKIDANGHETTLYSFTGADGSLPYGDLIRDQHGNLYGTTLIGGALGGGVVFKVNPAGKETVLHDFTTIPGGYQPYAGLFRDRNGNLYGTTGYGGDAGCGAGGGGCGLVFKLTACPTPFCQGGGD